MGKIFPVGSSGGSGGGGSFTPATGDDIREGTNNTRGVTAAALTDAGVTPDALAARAPAGGVWFDGESGFLRHLDAAEFVDGPFSIGLWAKIGNVGDNSWFFQIGDVDSSSITFSDTTTMQFFVRSDGTHGRFDWSFPQDEAWHHYLLTFDPSNLNSPVLYIDGVEALRTTVTTPAGSWIVPSGSLLYAGDLIYSNLSLRIPSVFNRALSAAEVQELYEHGGALPAGPQWRWGSVSPTYTSDFSSGTDSWVEQQTNITGNVDADADGVGVPPSDNWMKLESITRNQISYGAVNSVFPDLSKGTRYRVKIPVYITAGHQWITNPNSFVFAFYGDGVYSTTPIETPEVGLKTYTFDIVFDGGSYAQFRIGTIFTVSAGQVAYIGSGATVTRLGTLAYLPMSEGVGRQLRDVSPNGYHGLLGETGFEHLLPASDASIDVSDVDASSRVALLEDSDILPENAVAYAASVRIGDEWYDVDFDSAVAQDRTKRSIEVFATGAPETLYFYRGDDTSDFASVQIGATTIDQIILHYRKAS